MTSFVTSFSAKFSYDRYVGKVPFSCDEHMATVRNKEYDYSVCRTSLR